MSDVNYAYSEEAYFLLYENKASKMKGWQIQNELAIRLEEFDLLKSANSESPEGTRMLDRAMRQIEILSKESLQRK